MKNEIDELLSELDRKIRQMPPEQVSYKIIKIFTEEESHFAELGRKFREWLFSTHNEEAKKKAFERCFDEMINNTSYT